MGAMVKKERTRNVLGGKPVDRMPVGFQLHLPEETHHGERTIEAHLDSMRATGTDILEIMNENILHDRNTKVERPGDISRFRGFSRKGAILQSQMEVIKRIADKTKGEYSIISATHSLIASAFHEIGFADNYISMGYQITLFCRERPAKMREVLRTMVETLMEFSDCSLEADAEGIFYAVLGEKRDFFTNEGLEEFVAPYEKMTYDHIKETTGFNVLHICKSNIDFNRYKDPHPVIVDWGIYGNGFNLTKGAGLFGDSITLGGFPDRHGVLITGTEEEIFKHTSEVLEEMKGGLFTMGSDCIPPTEIAYDRIRCAADSMRKLEQK